MKLQKRQLRKQRELIQGTTQATLIETLNGDASLSPKARKRVAEILELTQQAESLDMRSHAEERDRVLEQLNEKLLRYRWSPQLEKSESMLPGLVPFFSYHTTSLEERHENWCAWWITELVRQRNILRVRRCVECGHWLWAVREHQKHCSGTCRKRNASHNPVFKEKRRQFMVTYRRQEKERNQRAKRLVRRGEK